MAAIKMETSDKAFLAAVERAKENGFDKLINTRRQFKKFKRGYGTAFKFRKPEDVNNEQLTN